MAMINKRSLEDGSAFISVDEKVRTLTFSNLKENHMLIMKIKLTLEFDWPRCCPIIWMCWGCSWIMSSCTRAPGRRPNAVR